MSHLFSQQSIRHLLLLFTLLMSCNNAFAEVKVQRFFKWFDQWLEAGQLEGIDTLYVGIPQLNHQVYVGSYVYWHNYKMHMPFDIVDASTFIPGIHDSDRYDINANTWQTELEIGIDWKGLALEIPIPIRNKYQLSLGLAKNGSVWGARVRYKYLPHMSGSCNIGDREIDEESNALKIFYLEGYYVLFHKKFSLSAGLYADMVQKRSAGSPLIYANYYQSIYDINKTFPANYDHFRTRQISLGAGYAYNFSFLEGKLVFHTSLVPMFSFYNHLAHYTNYDDGEDLKQWADFYDAADGKAPRVKINAFARFAANYSFSHYIISLLANYRYFGYSNTKNLKIINQEADFQINLCRRF